MTIFQVDVVVEFTKSEEKGRWCVCMSKSGQLLEQGLFIETSLILSMPLPQDLLQLALNAAIISNPLL
jgi:hypothetical protein